MSGNPSQTRHRVCPHGGEGRAVEDRGRPPWRDRGQRSELVAGAARVAGGHWWRLWLGSFESGCGLFGEVSLRRETYSRTQIEGGAAVSRSEVGWDKPPRALDADGSHGENREVGADGGWMGWRFSATRQKSLLIAPDRRQVANQCAFRQVPGAPAPPKQGLPCPPLMGERGPSGVCTSQEEKHARDSRTAKPKCHLIMCS